MLDEAGVKAVKRGDIEGMLAVANGWMQFGTVLANPDGEEDEDSDEDVDEEELLSDTRVMGFQSPETREVLESDHFRNRR